jgi:hypothetical protein
MTFKDKNNELIEQGLLPESIQVNKKYTQDHIFYVNCLKRS